MNCNCNNCNRAARPGTSNHQSGHALDLNTSAPGVLSWLNANGARFGFSRTVPSEAWHWEWWGGGPGGGPCGATRDNCTTGEAEGCGRFGCGCVDHQCSGGFCPGTGCTAQHTRDCGTFGCGCSTGECAGGTCPGTGCTVKETMDCAGFGCGCVDHLCNGGACEGSGCTARQTLDCDGQGKACSRGACVARPSVPPVVDAGVALVADAGVHTDAGALAREEPVVDETDPTLDVAPVVRQPVSPEGVVGSCAAAPLSPTVLTVAVLLSLRRRRRDAGTNPV